ncbi:MAG TPA: ATP-binding protein [Candidatus Omnitrophota bacterium]|nr:ATP-binding protein [Candidatus Omnitrophota bacterium]HRY85331.1 ATP-binding protein [Candidatus Omnitrophota bacterium]
MPFPKLGFAKRLLFFYGFVFIAVLLLTDWSLSRVLEKRELEQLQDSLTRQSILIREVASPLLERTLDLQNEIKKLAEGTGLRITVVNAEGTPLADSSETHETLANMDNHAMRPEIAAALKEQTGMSIRYSTTVKTRMLYVAVPIFQGEKILGVVRAAMPIARVDRILASARKPVMVTALLGILMVLAAGILFAGRLTARIRRITSVAERYAQEDWSEKILIDGRDELKMLADTMNKMASSLKTRIDDLENEKGKVATILTHMNEGVIAIGPRKQFVMANPTAERFFGFETKTVGGKGLIEVTRHPQLERIVDRAFEARKNLSEEIQIPGNIKKTFRVNVLMLPPQIREIGCILVFHDMTEIRRLENIRKEFVANVSHELRTPLTSIRGFIETLLGGALKEPATSEHFLRIMEEETKRLGRLVEDILTLGEIEQRATLLRKEKIDLALELSTVLERFKPRIQEKRIAVENRILGKSFVVSGDRDKVQQVLVNLIDNAIKFNKEEGKIVLSADQRAEGLAITVEDTGIGIPQGSIERIFERFFRVDKARSKELGGTGLGLAIVKHIMEAHGGHAVCSSTLGKGSRFTVFFPG